MAAEAAVEAIHRAVREGNAETVARMLDEDAQLLTTMSGGSPLLTRAAIQGHVGMVKLLLERGVDVNVNTSTRIRGTALHSAAFRGHEEVVSTLLSSGADVYRRNAEGWTALMYASLGGHVAVVRLLMRSMGEHRWIGRIRDGCRALYWACYSGHADVVRALLLAGADHTIGSDYGRMPQRIAQNRSHLECVAMIQWWEGELARAYVLHKARTLHNNTATHQEAPAAPMPAYLRPRVQEGSLMPSVEVVTTEQGGEEGAAKRERGDRWEQKQEEEVCAMVGFVVKDLDGHLYTELLAGLHH